MNILTAKLWFPKPEEADFEGLLAVGGDLSVGDCVVLYHCVVAGRLAGWTLQTWHETLPEPTPSSW